ncbi:ribonuclease Z [Halocola ammonii]
MKFEVNILGCGAATPTLKRNPTAQLVNLHDKFFLVDCGEGTQVAMRKNKLKFQKINHIFISHLHGDHYLGLVGLISSMHLLGRNRKLTIYGPPGIREIVEVNLKLSQTVLNFECEIIELDLKEKTFLFDDKSLEVFAFPLKHRITCNGFLFREKKRKPKIDKKTIADFDLSVKEIVALKNGQDVQREDSTWLKFEELTNPAPEPRGYGYCSDTKYWERVVDFISECNLLYHESTFLDDKKDRAKETFHSTARQAGKIAQSAKVKQLILGHFSSRYRQLDGFLEEAKEEFENVILASDGLTVTVPQ